MAFTNPKSTQSLLSRGRNFEVGFLNKDTKQIQVVIHVNCSQHELKNPEIEGVYKSIRQWGMQYLIDEGFMDNFRGWHLFTKVVGHEPKEQ